MRQLYPTSRDEDLDALYTELDVPAAPADRPWTYLDMVASVDGAAALDGRAGGLGGEADRLAFSRLREWCDAILVGAETVRAEDYGPPRPTKEAQARRRARGLESIPRLIVVTASADLDPGARLFADPQRRPLLLVPEDVTLSADLARVADAVAVGQRRVGLRAAFARLRAMGIARLLCEGGPSLNVELLREDLVDELFLTIAPLLVGSDAPRIVTGDLAVPRTAALVELREHEGALLARYRLTAGG